MQSRFGRVTIALVFLSASAVTSARAQQQIVIEATQPAGEPMMIPGLGPDQEGRFRLRNLPAGSYNIVAVDYIEAGAWRDPELLDRLKSHAKRITLLEGGSEKVELKLVDQY